MSVPTEGNDILMQALRDWREGVDSVPVPELVSTEAAVAVVLDSKRRRIAAHN